MPVTYGPQAPGWDPTREQDRARVLAARDAAVTAAGVVTNADGDLAEDIWQELQSAAAGIAPGTAPRHGPQLATWDPFREQAVERVHAAVARVIEAARVVAAADGDGSDPVWQGFDQALQAVDFSANISEFFPP